jgi:kumamolisin
LIELGGGFRRRDLRRFFTGIGVEQPSVQAVSVAGARNRPTSPDSADGEVMLDIEVVGAVAPGAKIVVYFAPNTNRGFLRAVNAAIHDTVHQPSIISISWGGPESTWSLLDMHSLDQVFQAAAALGISVFVAAGDDGSTDGVEGTTPNVDFPASSPFVTACGGTRLVVAADNSITETVWNDGPGSGTGGGISAVFPPPDYQSGPGIVVPPSLDPTVGPGRGVPDIAGNADPATGYAIRVDAVDMVIGGTSAVAPLWAGLFACFNQGLGRSVGFANPLLYSVISATPGALRDVVTGNNDTTGRLGGYAARPGWDPCTGLGTPADAGKILGALQ